MNLYKLNRTLHRDLGYFFIGMTLIYAISGIAINHIKDWNPNYIIRKEAFQINANLSREQIDKQKVSEILSSVNVDSYKSHYFPKNNILKIFIDGGSVTCELNTGYCEIETIKRRPLFFHLNKMHYNPGKTWTYFSDFYCVALAFLAISGLFIIKGKNGLKWRGTILGIIGIIIPILILLLYL
ncbi:MAG: PepSY-associated TM helix domain-containing protein [Ignavibacteria bacterium]|nr:PepSY-associated TM helix domain-containing protein [Ignavibacteria bacterium]